MFALTSNARSFAETEMAVLPYCVILADLKIEKPSIGVDGKRVESLSLETLRIYYSDFADPALGTDVSRQSALEFHRVIAAVFRQTAVVPFRFPNVLRTREELKSHLRTNLNRYRSFLEKTQDAVQMEVMLKPMAPSADNETKKSGTEYLREKQQQSRALTELSDLVMNKARELILSSKTTDLRLYLLVPRNGTDDLRKRLSDLQDIRISGPWPAAEFLEATGEGPNR